jgi:hypothetical protein
MKLLLTSMILIGSLSSAFAESNSQPEEWEIRCEEAKIECSTLQRLLLEQEAFKIDEDPFFTNRMNIHLEAATNAACKYEQDLISNGICENNNN